MIVNVSYDLNNVIYICTVCPTFFIYLRMRTYRGRIFQDCPKRHLAVHLATTIKPRQVAKVPPSQLYPIFYQISKKPEKVSEIQQIL